LRDLGPIISAAIAQRYPVPEPTQRNACEELGCKSSASSTAP